LVGRAEGCELVLDDPQVSRHHFIVRMTVTGPELVPLGRNPILVNGDAVAEPTSLQDNDSIESAGYKLSLLLRKEESQRGPSWALRLVNGARFGMSDFPFSIGGGEGDSLYLPGLAAASLEIQSGDGGLQLTASVLVHVDDEELALGAGVGLREGSRIKLGDHSLVLNQIGLTAPQTTVLDPSFGEPGRVHLQFLPVGGRLTIGLGSQQLALYLSERRCALLAVLLAPPKGYDPGEFIPDDLLYPRVWGRDGGDRNALNVLISRTRKEFHQIGLDGFSLIERLPSGGATRFRLGEDTEVEVS
jgi:hypothetical protein